MAEGGVFVATLCGTLFCVAAALFVDSFNFASLSGERRTHAILVDIFLPVCLAGPMMGFLMSKLRELAVAKHELTILASTDSLTSVLNRGAFSMIVDSYLDSVQSARLSGPGALLVVDVDNFKRINDNFGHDRGDAALQLIVKAILGEVRDVDLVGGSVVKNSACFSPVRMPLKQPRSPSGFALRSAWRSFHPMGRRGRSRSASVGPHSCAMSLTNNCFALRTSASTLPNPKERTALKLRRRIVGEFAA